MGIIDFFAKKAEDARRRAEEEAAAERARRKEMESLDVLRWVGIHSGAAMVHNLRAMGAYDAAMEKASEVLTDLEELYFPGEEGDKCRREIYGCIGRCIYEKTEVEDLQGMEEALRYFEMAGPMSQADIEVALTKLSTLRILDVGTDEIEYSEWKYSLAQEIYSNRKDELSYEGWVKLVFKSLIEEKLIGKVCMLDKLGARDLAEEMLRMAPSLIEEYDRFNQYM